MLTRVPSRGALVALGLLAACGAETPERYDRASAVRQPFDSAEATLLDFDVDGRLFAATGDPAKLRPLVEAQLLYTVGPLNAERSVGSYGAASITGVTATRTAGGEFEVRYRAKLPVAWGGGTAPASYRFQLPRSVGSADQLRFSKKYAGACADPEGGITSDSDAGRMYLFYRPERAGCTLAAGDVVSVQATVTPSAANTSGKYPEYRRIWSDGVLRIVTVFSVEEEDTPSDEGRIAFDRFLQRSSELLGAPFDSQAHLERTFDDGRRVEVEARLVGPSLETARTELDDWFDAVTPAADLVLYTGHAGLGRNIRALAQKGRFVTGQYVLWVTNGCDTLAYVDRTLATRRAALNPDDPAGTKYMDVVSNALGSWFHAGDDTALHFVRDLTIAGGPTPIRKTYRQIFADVDPSQVIVVTGEEDNEDPPAARVASMPAGSLAPIPVGRPGPGERDEAVTAGRAQGCASAPPPRGKAPSNFVAVAAVVVAAAAIARRRRVSQRDRSVL